MLRLLQENRYDPQKKPHRELLASTSVALRRAWSIVNDLINLPGLENNSYQVELEPVRLKEALSDSAQLVTIAAAENDVILDVQYPADDLMVVVGRDLLLRVFDNFLFNAVRNTLPGEAVTLAAIDQGEQVEVRITNPGEKVDVLNPDELFEKFMQVKHQGTRKLRGASLGLYFCKLAVEAMQGEIRASVSEQGEWCFSVSVDKEGAIS
ncbi:MAG: HAMP domain-containing histidine kinase [candidate division Zixibacteria bacterium]|nr:HAMP domain-containing histidine kinase [candidate division Zixibacteria bacterium]